MTRRGAKFMVHVLGTLVGVASVLLAGAAWRLAQGPVDLDELTPYIEAALNGENTGYHFEIGAAELAWGDWQRAFDLRMLDVNVTHDDGTPAFGASEVLLEMALPPLVQRGYSNHTCLRSALANGWALVMVRACTSKSAT